MQTNAPSAPVDADSPFATLEARHDALRLGMWTFLGSETLLFAGLFGLYASYRTEYPVDFLRAARENEEWIGSTNTFVLIISSFFAAWAVHAAREARVRAARASLLAVIGLGTVFLGLKALEYAHHLAHGIAPGALYHYAALPQGGARSFFTLYYFMTGLHALHVIAGMSVMVWLLWRIRRSEQVRARCVDVELGALYWHLVDIVWIFLWPLLYLVE
jgi:cytochrome c oxidase subunit 3